MMPVNVGTGSDISIRELADLVARSFGYRGEILWDQTKPDGTFRKLLDVSQMTNLGWESSISLASGISRLQSELLGLEWSGDE
jgi:GDP-L-fucose synthase